LNEHIEAGIDCQNGSESLLPSSKVPRQRRHCVAVAVTSVLVTCSQKESTSTDLPIPLAPWIKMAEEVEFLCRRLVVGLSLSSPSSLSPLQSLIVSSRAVKSVCISSPRPTFITAVKSSLTEFKSPMLHAGGYEEVVKSRAIYISHSLSQRVVP
jgi:hypothetical protein